MVKYFCDCCGREMDNSISHQLIFRAKNPKVVGENKNEVYSPFDDERKVCDDCFNYIMKFIDDKHVEESPSVVEESTLNDLTHNEYHIILKFLSNAAHKLYMFIMKGLIIFWYDFILKTYDNIYDIFHRNN